MKRGYPLNKYACLMLLSLVALPGAAKAANTFADTLAATAAGTNTTAAATAPQGKEAEYLALVAKAQASPANVDWETIRNAYVQTSYYDPYGGAQAIWYSLQRAGQRLAAENTPDALAAYNELQTRHYAHYRAHLQAVDLYDKTKLQHVDREAHFAALKGILNSILATGDGKTPETAYRVIDPAEEMMIIKALHLKNEGQDFRQKEGHFWDVQKYVNPMNSQKGEMFFNVDAILMAPPRAKTPVTP